MPSVEAEERENPNTDGFRIELIGEIANMATLSTGTAESVGSELRRASVKVVAGARNWLDLLLNTSIAGQRTLTRQSRFES